MNDDVYRNVAEAGEHEPMLHHVFEVTALEERLSLATGISVVRETEALGEAEASCDS